MQLSVVIVSWNVCELLKSCLESVVADVRFLEFEIIVVDNASSDGTTKMLKDTFPGVTLVENKENVGFGRANNQGIQASQGRFVLLLNPDTIIKPGAIPKLLEFLEKTPQAACAGPRLFNSDGSFQYSCSPAPTLSGEFKRLFHLPGIRPDGYYAMEKWDLSKPRAVEVLLGACMLFRQDALESVGLFDEDYFMYSEEVDLCQRLRVKGWRLFWIPEAGVVHYGKQSTNQMASEMFINLYQSKVTYFNKHFGVKQAQYYQLLLKFVAFSRLVSAPVVWLFVPGKRFQQQYIFKNYHRLLFQSFDHSK